MHLKHCVKLYGLYLLMHMHTGGFEALCHACCLKHCVMLAASLRAHAASFNACCKLQEALCPLVPSKEALGFKLTLRPIQPPQNVFGGLFGPLQMCH